MQVATLVSRSVKNYEVQIHSCPCNFPIPFISHNWIVIIENGRAERWEAGYMRNIGEYNYGHIRKNVINCSPFDGITVFPGIELRWRGRLIGVINGGIGSDAHKMVEFIRKSPQNYPYLSSYSLLGPNSNTYVQWVLDSFPNLGLSLPKNAIGKSY